MFDVYLDDKRGLLVLPKGMPIPVGGTSGRWRKKKAVVSISEEIRLAVRRDGYYWRRLGEMEKSKRAVKIPIAPNSLARADGAL
jgi:hypothetical protein